MPASGSCFTVREVGVLRKDEAAGWHGDGAALAAVPEAAHRPKEAGLAHAVRPADDSVLAGADRDIEAGEERRHSRHRRLDRHVGDLNAGLVRAGVGGRRARRQCEHLLLHLVDSLGQATEPRYADKAVGKVAHLSARSLLALLEECNPGASNNRAITASHRMFCRCIRSGKPCAAAIAGWRETEALASPSTK